jgi:hypothetical protein
MNQNNLFGITQFSAYIILVLSIWRAILEVKKAILEVKKAKIEFETSNGKQEPIKKNKIKIYAIGLFILLASGVLVSLIYNNYFYTVKKPKIAIFVPYDSDKLDIQMDAQQQILGFSKLICRDPKLTQEFDFEIITHGNEYDKVKSEIFDQINKGTKYFLITMSAITVRLSQEIDSLCNSISDAKKPIIVATASSSPELRISNRFFRFYIRSQEEAKFLSKAAYDILGARRVAYLISGNSFGRGSKQAFEENWNWNNLHEAYIVGGIEIKDGAEIEAIKKQIKNDLLLFSTKCDAIFVAHYGAGLDNIIRALDELGIKKPIIATSTLTTESWRGSINPILAKLDWISCVPTIDPVKYNKAWQEDDTSRAVKYKGDVVLDFAYYSLLRLTTVIKRADSLRCDFDKAWLDCLQPKEIIWNRCENDSKDSEIKLEIFGEINGRKL